jgi:hypothetical protein
MTPGAAIRAVAAATLEWIWQEICVALVALSAWLWHGEDVEHSQLDAVQAQIADSRATIEAMRKADEQAGAAAIEAARRCKVRM